MDQNTAALVIQYAYLGGLETKFRRWANNLQWDFHLHWIADDYHWQMKKYLELIKILQNKYKWIVFIQTNWRKNKARQASQVRIIKIAFRNLPISDHSIENQMQTFCRISKKRRRDWTTK